MHLDTKNIIKQNCEQYQSLLRICTSKLTKALTHMAQTIPFCPVHELYQQNRRRILLERFASTSERHFLIDAYLSCD